MPKCKDCREELEELSLFDLCEDCQADFDMQDAEAQLDKALFWAEQGRQA